MVGHGSRGPSPLRPGVMSGQSSFRPEEMSPIDDDMHPVIHAGRVAVVTGAASGIGRAAAKEFARCAPPRIHRCMRADQPHAGSASASRSRT
jgi:hypothetical protein